MDQTYWGSEVAKNLGIGSSTLRKYCLAPGGRRVSFRAWQ